MNDDPTPWDNATESSTVSSAGDGDGGLSAAVGMGWELRTRL